MAAMRRNNKRNNEKKERVIMIASSVFVLSALTLTGIYMKTVNRESQDDGYKIDFTTLENNADDKFQEIAQNDQWGSDIGMNNPFEGDLNGIYDPQDDMDYMPMEEVGSGLVEIPGLTDGGIVQEELPSQGELILPKETIAPPAATQKPAADVPKQEAEVPKQEAEAPRQEAEVPKQAAEEPNQEAGQLAAAQMDEDQPENTQPAEGAAVVRTLNFAESEGLVRPVSGEVLMPYSMDGSIYFSTMRDYRYNPALMLEAETGTHILACAAGKVVNIFSNEEIGHAVTMDLGNGYLLTYGQLEGINVTLNSYVDRGDMIASVANPTKYYCVEGSNLYLAMTKDGQPMNPEPLFR